MRHVPALLLAACLAALPALADEHAAGARAVVSDFYARVAAGDLDGAWALTDGASPRADFDARWGGLETVELYDYYAGELFEGLLYGNVDHCVGRDGVFHNWQGLLRLRRVDGAWRIHDWDADTMAYSIGDACWEGGHAAMLESMTDEAAVIGGSGAERGSGGLGARTGSSDLGLDLGRLGTRGAGSEPKDGTPRGRIVQATYTTEPAGEESGLRKVFQRRGGALKYCYERVLVKEHGTAGTLVVTFEVSKDGAPSKVEPRAGVHDEVDACVLRQVTRSVFPPPGAPYAATVSWEFGPVPD